MKKMNLFIRMLLKSMLFFLLCLASNVNGQQIVSGDSIINQVISEDTAGVKNRNDAILYFKSKMKYFRLNKKNNLVSFDCSIPIGLTDNDLKYLVFFPEVSSIHLSDKNISDYPFYYFQNLKKLSAISLISTSVTGNGFKYLLDKSELESFNFSNSPITDEGLKYLSEIKYKNPIIILNLKGSKVTDTGMQYIAKMKFDRGRIILNGTSVTDEGIKHLAGFKNMIEIFLYNTKVTDKGGKWLESQLPDTTVYWGKQVPKKDDSY